jgi:GBP family porin
MIRPLAILVALGGFATAAAAQSSTVTIYGLVDLNVQYLRSGDRSPLAGNHLTRLADGTTYGPGSRWGIRVGEDLGGGLSAGVLMEAGLLADTGALAQGGLGWGRQVFVRLSSTDAGELRLGRQYILHDETMGYTNLTGNITALNPGGVFNLKTGTFPIFIDAPRMNNALHYLSPTLSGFRGQAMLGLGEGTADRYHGLKVTYDRGPLSAAAAYEQSKALAVPAGGKSTVNKIFEGGVTYDFGAFKLAGGYQQGKDLTTGSGTQIGTLTFPGLPGPATSSKAYNVGASMPLGVAILVANYAHGKFTSASGADVTIGHYGVSATYYLSKLTAIYAAAAFASGDLKDDVNEKQLFQLGLRKSF